MSYKPGDEVLVVACKNVKHFLTLGSFAKVLEIYEVDSTLRCEGINKEGASVLQIVRSQDVLPSFKPGDKVRIRKNSQYYGDGSNNPISCEGAVTQIDPEELKGNLLDAENSFPIEVNWDNGVENHYSYFDLEYVDKTESVLVEETQHISKQKPITEMANTAQKNAVLVAAMELLQGNPTVTIEEVKAKLRTNEPEYHWTQTVVKEWMESLTKSGLISCRGKDYCLPGAIMKKPVVKIKSLKKTKTGKSVTISKTKALELMKNSGGRFFTAIFCKKDGSLRVMNCQFRRDQPQAELGYIRVNETGLLKKSPTKAIRQINIQTLKSLTIAGTQYILRG
jgi:hypothetical protein